MTKEQVDILFRFSQQTTSLCLQYKRLKAKKNKTLQDKVEQQWLEQSLELQWNKLKTI